MPLVPPVREQSDESEATAVVDAEPPRRLELDYLLHYLLKWEEEAETEHVYFQQPYPKTTSDDLASYYPIEPIVVNVPP